MLKIKTADYQTSGTRSEHFPQEGLPEFVFCGRSNVGKSSFINALVNRKALARTSSNPGKTQTINFFLINEAFYLVDVPGYGYAKVSKSVKEAFGKMLEAYLSKRVPLKAAFLLVDYRHDPTKDDVLMYKYLSSFGYPVYVLATKKDKLKNSELVKNKKAIISQLNITDPQKFIVTSSEEKEGMDMVLEILENLMKDETAE